jgi:hypothetical protein
LGEKLERMRDASALRAFELAVRPPLTSAEVPDHLDRVSDLLDQYLQDVDTDGWQASLRWAVGTAQHDFGSQRLVSRWQMRTAAFSAPEVPAGIAGWDYDLDEVWDSDPATLFAHDLLWLGLRSRS